MKGAASQDPDAIADEWVTARDPDPDPAVWPAPDEGRPSHDRRTRPQEPAPLQPSEGNEWALRVDPDWQTPDYFTRQDTAMRAALAELYAHQVEARRAAPPPSPYRGDCEHCGLAEIQAGGLCGRCWKYGRRHDGALPGARLNALHRRRLDNGH